jgi:hypothetical protein
LQPFIKALSFTRDEYLPVTNIITLNPWKIIRFDPNIHSSLVFLKDLKYQIHRLLALVDELDMFIFRLRRVSEALMKLYDDLSIKISPLGLHDERFHILADTAENDKIK